MFGIDARVAVFIFLTLSTIVGTVGLMRITAVKHSALIKELSALEEAFNIYQTDMGVFMRYTINGGSDGVKDFEILWDKTDVASGFRKYWNGPYYSHESLVHDTYGTFSISYAQADRSTACTHSTACYAWINLTDVPAATWAKVNSYFDESLGSAPETPGSLHDSGRVHASSAVADPRTLYFRIVDRPKN